MKIGFGVDIGGTTVKLAVFTKEGKLLSKWEIPTAMENFGSRILPDVADSVLEYCRKNEFAKGDVVGLGIGVPGPVTPDGVVNGCINLGWGRVDICKALGSLTGFRVVAGNDATVAALGECWQGGGKGFRNMVLVTLGTGVGGGIVVDGRLLWGSHGAGGELGHITLNRQETETCNCGKRGCAEQYCSATGIVRQASAYLAEAEEESILRNKNFSCKDVFDAAAQGDGPAKAVLEQVYQYMGAFLADVCCVVDPEVVVLGGGVSKAGQPLLEGVKRHFAKVAFPGCADTQFALATLGNDAGVYGAFKLISE